MALKLKGKSLASKIKIEYPRQPVLEKNANYLMGQFMKGATSGLETEACLFMQILQGKPFKVNSRLEYILLKKSVKTLHEKRKLPND